MMRAIGVPRMTVGRAIVAVDMTMADISVMNRVADRASDVMTCLTDMVAHVVTGVAVHTGEDRGQYPHYGDQQWDDINKVPPVEHIVDSHGLGTPLSKFRCWSLCQLRLLFSSSIGNQQGYTGCTG
jgi:hypothetical protein